MKAEEWKVKIMDYLYDEMSREERTAFEKELNRNPKLLEELQELNGQREILQAVEEEEVDAPAFIGVNQNGKTTPNPIKWFASVAATVLLFLLVGSATKVSIENTQEGFKIAFGQNEDQIPKAKVNQLIAEALQQYDQKLALQQERQSESIQKQLASYKDANQLVLDEYVEQLSVSNTRMMSQYWKKNNEQQQIYMRNLMSDFASYMDEKRAEDIDYLIAKMELLESDKELYKIETSQYLNAMASNALSERSAY
jgi:hypothetical protein